jgi:PAS domain S-box-containing protein
VSNEDNRADVARRDHEDVAALSISSQIGHFIKWKRAKRHTALLHEAGYLLLGLVSLATVTGLYFWLDVPLVSAAFTYLVVLVLLSLVGNFSSLIVLSFIGVGCLSYFFAPPIYSFRVDYPQDITTISAFLITSFIVNLLVTRVRDAKQRLEDTIKSLRIENVERERAEQALRESEYKLRKIFDTVPGLTWSTGSEGKKGDVQPGFLAQVQAILNVLPAYTWYSVPSGGLTFVNKRTADYLGIPKDHPLRSGIDIGAQWDDWVPLLHSDDQEEALQYWSNLLRAAEGGEHSYRVRDAQGNYRWFLTRIEPLRASDGTLLLWVGATLDIEDLKSAEQALRESEFKLRQIIETVPALLWSSAPNGELTDVNQRILEHYFGVRFENLQHRGWADLVHPDDLAETANAFTHAIQTGTSYQAVHRLRRVEGEYRWHQSRSEPLRDRQENIIQWYGLTVDIDEAKKAEDRLRRSEANLAEAQKLSHTGSWVLSPATTKIHYWSEECYRIWGFDPVQGLPDRETVWRRVHPGDRDWMYKETQEALRQKRDYKVDFRIVLPDGTVKYLEAIGHHLFSEHGELVQVVGTNVDVTERKCAEEALRESESKIRRLVDANIIGIFIWDFDGRILEANEAFLDIVGYNREDLVAGSIRWTDLTPPEWRDRDTRLIQEQRMTGNLQPFEKEYFRKDSSRVPVLIGVATFEEGGNQGVAFVLDLTQRKCAEQALRESEGKLRDYAETASDWFWEIGPDYKFTLLTENAFGSDSANRIGTACWEHALDLETEPEKWRLIQATLDSRKPFRDFVYCSARGDGTSMYVKASGKPVFDANGEFRGYRGTGTDATAIMRAQEEHERLRQLESDLAHMNRLDMMGQQAASLAHEVTQPIAAARNYARAALNFLDQQPPDLGEVKKQLGSVVDAADRSGEIIDRIRDHIKKAPPRKTHFDLNQAIDEVIALARSAIIRNGISVQTLLAEGLAPVQGDRVQLQQVVLNLVLNAVEAMGSVEAGRRQILISTEHNDANGVLVVVRDSGPGIEPENLERTFDAFYTTKASGMGMGLSICRSIIDGHGGRLWAGVNEPRGAVFQFTLPDAEKEITDPRRASLQTIERYEDSASDAPGQLACEDSKRPHRSGRVPDQRRSGRQ